MDADDFLPSPDQCKDVELPKELKNFTSQFNEDPMTTLRTLTSFDENYDDPYYLGKLFCISKDLQPRSITKVLTSKEYRKSNILYFFFTSFDIEYVPIVDAIMGIFPRLSMPKSQKKLRAIIKAFGEAYLAKNSSYMLTKWNISVIIAAILIFLVRSTPIVPNEISPNYINPDAFTAYLKDIMPDENIFLLHNCLNVKHGIQIEYSFSNLKAPPQLKREGQIKIIKSRFSFKKALFLKVDDDTLTIANDQKFTSHKLTIALNDVFAEVSDIKEGGYNLDISANSGRYLNIKPLKAVEGKETKKYSIYCDSKEELMEWADVINFTSFIGNLNSLLV